METFPSLGLPADFGPQLDELGITTPTPIQAAAIPILLQGKDLIGIAQTGTGKTLAFGLPVIEQIRQKGGKCLILAPTRELAMQIVQALRAFTGPLRLKSAVLVGGVGMQGQCADLRRRPEIVVATPGRLLDHVQKGNVRLREFDKVVLDEADRMLDMGFLPAIETILSGLARERQSMMFSATMPQSIEGLVERHLNNPERVEVTPPGTAVHLIEQAVYIVPQLDKNDLLDRLIKQVDGPVLVFARTRHGARKVAASLVRMGYDAAEIHSDRSQAQRDSAMNGFRTGRYRILVATDIAARGIDVKDIELVAQYDLPDNPEDYVHRIGRTGRAGATGRAVVFVTPETSRKLEELEHVIGFDIETAEDSPLNRPERRRRTNRAPKLPARGPDFRPPTARPRPAMEIHKRNDEWTADRPERARRPEHPFAARPETKKPERPAAYGNHSTERKPFEHRPARPPFHERRSDDRRYARKPERPAYKSDRPAFRDRPAYNNDRPAYRERPTYNERPPYQDRRDDRPYAARPETRKPDRPATYDRQPVDRRPLDVPRNERPWDRKPLERPAAPKPAPASGRPKPSGTPNAFKPKVKGKKGKGVPSGGFKVPKKKR